MKTKKNLYSLIVFCVIFSIMSSVTVSARNLHIDSTLTTLSIASGTATVFGKATGYEGTTTKVVVSLELQQYANGSWTTIQSCSETFNNYKGTLEKTYSVNSGYKYRVKATYSGYGNGSSYETITDYSNEVNY